MNKVIQILACSFILTSLATTTGLIIPGDITSLMSVVFSNIPTIKKGTDSRIGWGFRLGDNADFQVLVELGPQKFTQPLLNQASGSSNSKRSVKNGYQLENQIIKANDDVNRQELLKVLGGYSQ